MNGNNIFGLQSLGDNLSTNHDPINRSNCTKT